MNKRDLLARIESLERAQTDRALDTYAAMNRLCAAFGHVWESEPASNGRFARRCKGCRQTESSPFPFAERVAHA